LEAEAAAASVLAGIEAAAGSQPTLEAQVSPGTISEIGNGGSPNLALPDFSQPVQGHRAQAFAVRWTPDMPELPAEVAAVRALEGPRFVGVGVEEWREQASPRTDELSAEDIQIVESGQPIRGNLIAFPRELVAARKARARRAEGPYAALEAATQLSIFEVDPGAISTEPAATAGSWDEAAPLGWTAPEWSAIELDAQPARGEADEYMEEPVLQPVSASAIEPAPVSLRLLAAVVDVALIMAAVLVAAVMAAANAKALPGIHEAEVYAGLALLVAGAAYQALFFTLGRVTPGMKYVQISLCTLEGHSPTRAQRRRRLAWLFLSVLPVGLGFGWALFDDDRLTWHDRLSGTYPRRY
ncbi:MAG: RDD family protein, partial [Gemmataceae bacterium]